MKRTANPGSSSSNKITSQQYIAMAHELRSASFAKYIDVTVSRISGRIARAVQWLNSHPAFS
ncbi:MAG TPA: hypothetical protein PK620_05480 [Denitromonas sp.]|uniref:hypothetical protein n=1 Tax=Denitromonas sp. TaxID=2734609 RepID=UPI001D967F40|nr:hypothetical protein [Rhodocyclaceae bacterium]MCP5220580.1 hypothetical protein [Zoogloeaceae bacterium]HPR05030.1 hypothetical protein [Denitromonas sp.]HQU88213.1 hypothetical protein [Denitromonas sp.]HQV14345.1 hypothetical protein [Denitromonas sp.]